MYTINSNKTNDTHIYIHIYSVPFLFFFWSFDVENRTKNIINFYSNCKFINAKWIERLGGM